MPSTAGLRLAGADVSATGVGEVAKVGAVGSEVTKPVLLAALDAARRRERGGAHTHAASWRPMGCAGGGPGSKQRATSVRQSASWARCVSFEAFGLTAKMTRGTR